MSDKAWKKARRRARLAVNVRASIEAACPRWRKLIARVGLPGPAQRWTVRYCRRHEQAIRDRIAKKASHYTMRPYDSRAM